MQQFELDHKSDENLLLNVLLVHTTKMTVKYTSQIANGRKYVCFWNVLIRWRGSLYKLIWQDLLCYCVIFLLIHYINIHILPIHMQVYLHTVKSYMSANVSMFPVSFMLSFFVDQVATKWWRQFRLVPSPDMLGIYAIATVPGKDETSRMIRRTIVRYAVLSSVLTLRSISTSVKKRFPTIKHVEDAGLILADEVVRYNKLDGQLMASNWLPLVWAANVANYAKSIKKVSSEQCLRLVITELTSHRDKLGTLVGYDLVSIPLAYTQTMVVAVLSYIIITLFINQPVVNGSGYAISDFTMVSLSNFIIYVGLMKVATVMLNPFGEDDDDFELNALIDRHFKAAYMIVDEMHEEEPDIVKDAFWDEVVPLELPYTVGSSGFRRLDPYCYSEEICKRTKQIKNKRIKDSSKYANRRKSVAPKEIKMNNTNCSRESEGNLYENINIDFVSKNRSGSQDCMPNSFKFKRFPKVTNPVCDFQIPSCSTSRQYPN